MALQATGYRPRMRNIGVNFMEIKTDLSCDVVGSKAKACLRFD